MVESKAIAAVANNLKSQPLALALIIINLVFIGAGVWVLDDIATNERARTEALNALLKQCVERQDGKNAR
jgi:hypothetical protein